MKYLSIDLETAGLDPKSCQILEFGAVLDDTNWWTGEKRVAVDSLPYFHAYIVSEDGMYHGQPYALWLNAEIFKKISNASKEAVKGNLFLYPKRLGLAFKNWLRDDHGITGKINVAGKNFASFDQKFLEELPDWSVEFASRVLDPAAYYFDPSKDERLPDTKTCLERAGINHPVAHTAIEDAKDVIRLIRVALKYGKRERFEV
ncbi:MAG: hypothetical protein DWQ19_10960 [Crenarchaeota archaeon]|nr:MAG: hypothetical protein DWQ19_10960 [Thermoproteota archaeon]